MNVLVSGAAGFFGSHLCHKLTTEGNEVIAIDNSSDYYDVDFKKLRVEKLLTPLQLNVVNVGSGKPNSINYLIQIVNRVSNSNITFNRKTEHKIDVKKTMADKQYIQSLIKSKPSTDLETGILETIKWASNSEINPLIESWVDSGLN